MFRQKMKLYKPEDLIKISDFITRGILDMTTTNTRNCPYLFKDKTFRKYFDHTKAKTGNRFYDGNNGDQWRVIYNNGEDRMLVQNLSQEFVVIIIY